MSFNVSCVTAHVSNNCAEDATDGPFVGEAPTDDGKAQLRSAALDAYRVSPHGLLHVI